MKAKNIALFLLVFMILILGISSINAADVSAQDSTADIVTTDNSLDSSIEQIVQEDSNVKTSDIVTDVNQDAAKINKDDVNVNTDKLGASTKVITNATFSQYFTNTGLTSKVSNGDTLDFQGLFNGSQYTIRITKPVNIISSTHDAFIDTNTTAASFEGDDDVSGFFVLKGGSYTNITGLTLHNTQFMVKNATHVTVDGNSHIVENQIVGRGVGQTTFRENSSYCTIKNSLIYTHNNGGSSSMVFSWANHCLVENCTVVAIGNVGNLVYVNTYNVEIPDGALFNYNNTIRNNRLYHDAENPAAICYGVAIHGYNTLIENNTIMHNGSAITTGSTTDNLSNSHNTTIKNNIVLGMGTLLTPDGGKVINNTIGGKLIVTTNNSVIENNTFGGALIKTNGSVVSKNVFEGTVEIGESAINLYQVTLTNNTINGDVLIVKGNQKTRGGKYNTTISNNIITGSIIGDKNNYNTSIISNDIVGTVVFNDTAENITIQGNSIITNQSSTINLVKRITNAAINNNKLNSATATGSNTINNSDSNTNVTIGTNSAKAKTTTISLSAPNAKINTPTTITATVMDSTLSPVSNMKVSIAGIKTTTNSNGVANVAYTPTNNSTVVTAIAYGSSTLASSTTDFTLTAAKLDTTTVVNQVTGKMGKKTLVVNTIDENGNVVRNGMVRMLKNNTEMGTAFVSYGYSRYVMDFASSSNNVTAIYNGSDIYNPSNNTIVVKLNKIAAIITGENVTGIVAGRSTFVAYVKDVNGDNVTEGKVTFTDKNGKVIATKSLVNGTASVSVIVNSTYNSKLSLSYSGSQKWIQAAGSSHIFIDKGQAKVVVSPVNGTVAGRVSLQATVTDIRGNIVTAGNVIFTDKFGDVIATKSVVNGVASTTAIMNKTYNSNIYANYTGSQMYNASYASAKIVIEKGQAKVIVSPASGVVANRVTLKANVTDIRGNVINAGSVTFIDKDGVVLATKSVVNSTASIEVIVNKTYNSHIYATYSGSQMYNSSVGAGNIVVVKGSSRTKFSNFHGTVGTRVTLRAVVVDSRNRNVTTGSVEFLDKNGNVLARKSVVNGEAITSVVFNSTYLGTITAHYLGSASFNESSLTATANITVRN